MARVPIQKRPNDLFVSYGHADRTVVDPIVDWLRRFAGLKVWYDPASGDASKRTTALLTEGMQSARGAMIVLSNNWCDSTWCKDEHEFAMSERRADETYLVVAIRIDDGEIPPWFTLSNAIDFRRFEARPAVDLLRSMQPDTPSRLDNHQDVYFAGPWSRPSSAVKPTLAAMSEVGWRLVGDSPDHPDFQDSATRIRSIIGTARGLVGLLPFDAARPPRNTSPWILKETQFAQEAGKPYLLLAEEGVQVPPELARGSFGAAALCITSRGPDSSFRRILNEFDDDLGLHPHSDRGAYSFLAASLREDQSESEDLTAVVERASNMASVRGVNLSGQHVQAAIVERIQNAGFVIADVSDDNRNTLIEAGVALGARTPLHLLCRPPADGSLKRRFMFEDREMHWYQNPVERLGLVYRIGKMYRRRIFKAQ
jgi:hypothetical protein